MYYTNNYPPPRPAYPPRMLAQYPPYYDPYWASSGRSDPGASITPGPTAPTQPTPQAQPYIPPPAARAADPAQTKPKRDEESGPGWVVFTTTAVLVALLLGKALG
jgi:hypothetical protein